MGASTRENTRSEAKCPDCGGIFSDEALLEFHVCPGKEPFISLDDMRAAVEKKVPFGVSGSVAGPALRELVAGIDDETVYVQRVVVTSERVIDDFEMRTLTVTYAQKR